MGHSRDPFFGAKNAGILALETPKNERFIISNLRLFCAVARKSNFPHSCIRFFCASFRLICKSLVFHHLNVYQEKERLQLKSLPSAFRGTQENVRFINSDLRLFCAIALKRNYCHPRLRFFCASFRRICKSLGFRYLSVYRKKMKASA